MINAFVEAQSDYTLGLYKEQAKNIFREFLNASYESELEEDVRKLISPFGEFFYAQN